MLKSVFKICVITLLLSCSSVVLADDSQVLQATNLEQTMFERPQGMAFDFDGRLIVADTFNHCVRMIENVDSPESGESSQSSDSLQSAVVTTILGKCGQAGFGNLPESTQNFKPSDVLLDHPMDVAVAKFANIIWVLDSYNNRIIKLSGETENSSSLEISLLSLDKVTGGTAFELKHASAIEVDQEQNVYIADTGNNRVLICYNQANTCEIYAGTGEAGYDPKTYDASKSRLNFPTDIINYNLGKRFFVADSKSGLIRWIRRGTEVSRVINNFAGSENYITGLQKSETAQLIKLERPYRLAVGEFGVGDILFVSEPLKKRILGITLDRYVFVAIEYDTVIPLAMAYDSGSLWVFDNAGKLTKHEIDYPEFNKKYLKRNRQAQ